MEQAKLDNKLRTHPRRRLSWQRLVVTAIMAVLGVTMVLPFLWMLSTSFKLPIDAFEYPVRWIPEKLHWENYEKVWAGNYPFALFYWNSIKVALFSVFGVLFFASMAGYGFARIPFKGRNTIFLILLSALMIPPQVILIPRFLMFNEFGLLNTHLALIIPFWFMVFGTFLMRQFYQQVPFDLSESAEIDGAGEFRIWWQVIAPLAKPAVVSLMILSFVWKWNDYLTPLVYLSSPRLFTIPVGLDYFVEENSTDITLHMTASVAATIPMLAVFIFGQKYFIRGIVATGLKG